MTIIPAIIGHSFEEIEAKMKAVEGLVKWVHIDIVDGSFTSPPTWPFTEDDVDDEIRRLNEIETELKIGLHLMTNHARQRLDEWLDTPAKRIFIHAESNTNLDDAMTILDMSKTDGGIVLNLETPIDSIEECADRVEVVQMMSIPTIGSYGAKFDDRVLSKIEETKKKYPKIKISVDGGINKNNLKKVMEAGADSAVCGSAIFGTKNIPKAIEELKKTIGQE